MPDTKPKPEEEGSVTKPLSMLGELGAEAAKGLPKVIDYGSDTLSSMYQKLREEAGEVLSYNPQQDEHPHGFIKGGNIRLVGDPEDPNNPYQAHITYEQGKPGELVRVGQDYKGPLTARPKSDKKFAYEHGYEGTNIVEIADIPRGLDGKPTGVVVLTSDDELLFIPKESLGRLPNPEALLRKMKAEAQAEEEALESAEMEALRQPNPVLSDMGREFLEDMEAVTTPFVSYQQRAREIEGDALGYAAEHGPYHGQNLTDEEVYEASAKDFAAARDDPDGGEVETREIDGAVITEFGNGTFFMWTGEGNINVTGHPGYDHTHPDYKEPQADEEG